MFLSPGDASSRDLEIDIECEIAAISPQFADDFTMFCVANEYLPGTLTPNGSVQLAKSSDGGGTWEQLPATGLQGLGVSWPSQLLVSPEYPEDNSIYVHMVFGTRPGLYRSTDGGQSFIHVGPLATTGFGWRALTPLLLDESLPAPIGSGREAFAYASPEDSPALISPPTHQPVVASPDGAVMFLMAPPDSQTDTVPLALARGTYRPGPDRTTWRAQALAYACDRSFNCPTKVFEFPPGWLLVDGRAIDGTTSYVVLVDVEAQQRIKVWRRTGQSEFKEWDSVNARIPTVDVASFSDPRVSIARLGGTKALLLRVSYIPANRNEMSQPADQLFVSKNDGQTWKRVAFGRGEEQKGKAGNLPWGRRAGPDHGVGDLLATPDGRLLVVASQSNSDLHYVGIFCSLDAGKTWTRGRCSAN